MYSVFKEAGTPLPRDPDLVDYGFNLEDESVFNDDGEDYYGEESNTQND